MLDTENSRVIHNDDDFAASVYCAVFKTDHDSGDFNTNAILTSLELLTRQEKHIIEAKYKFGFDNKTVYNEMKISKDRYKQILNNALCKLRAPIITNTISIYKLEYERDRLIVENDRLNTKIEKLIKEVNYLRSKENSIVESIPENKNVNLNLLISQTNLSIRVIRILHSSIYIKQSANTNTPTVYDIYQLDPDEFFNIPRLGIKACMEIIDVMHNLGFINWATMMKNNIYKLKEK